LRRTVPEGQLAISGRQVSAEDAAVILKAVRKRHVKWDLPGFAKL
jgi:hypothetical protein